MSQIRYRLLIKFRQKTLEKPQRQPGFEAISCQILTISLSTLRSPGFRTWLAQKFSSISSSKSTKNTKMMTTKTGWMKVFDERRLWLQVCTPGQILTTFAIPHGKFLWVDWKKRGWMRSIHRPNLKNIKEEAFCKTSLGVNDLPVPTDW